MHYWQCCFTETWCKPLSFLLLCRDRGVGLRATQTLTPRDSILRCHGEQPWLTAPASCVDRPPSSCSLSLEMIETALALLSSTSYKLLFSLEVFRFSKLNILEPQLSYNCEEISSWKFCAARKRGGRNFHYMRNIVESELINTCSRCCWSPEMILNRCTSQDATLKPTSWPWAGTFAPVFAGNLSALTGGDSVLQKHEQRICTMFLTQQCKVMVEVRDFSSKLSGL